jgi:hypothetical protein
VRANKVPDRLNADKLLRLQQIPGRSMLLQSTRILSFVWFWADQKPEATNLDVERAMHLQLSV